MPWYTAAPTGKQWEHVAAGATYPTMLMSKDSGINLSNAPDYTKPIMHGGSDANTPVIYGQKDAETLPIHFKSTIIWFFKASFVVNRGNLNMSIPKLFYQSAPLRSRSMGRISCLRHGVK